jgi:hypothetical protein
LAVLGFAIVLSSQEIPLERLTEADNVVQLEIVGDVPASRQESVVLVDRIERRVESKAIIIVVISPSLQSLDQLMRGRAIDDITYDQWKYTTSVSKPIYSLLYYVRFCGKRRFFRAKNGVYENFETSVPHTCTIEDKELSSILDDLIFVRLNVAALGRTGILHTLNFYSRLTQAVDRDKLTKLTRDFAKNQRRLIVSAIVTPSEGLFRLPGFPPTYPFLELRSKCDRLCFENSEYTIVSCQHSIRGVKCD